MKAKRKGSKVKKSGTNSKGSKEKKSGTNRNESKEKKSSTNNFCDFFSDMQQILNHERFNLNILLFFNIPFSK